MERRFRVTHGGCIDRPLLENLTDAQVVRFALAIPSQFADEPRVEEQFIRRFLAQAAIGTFLGLNGDFEVQVVAGTQSATPSEVADNREAVQAIPNK